MRSHRELAEAVGPPKLIIVPRSTLGGAYSGTSVGVAQDSATQTHGPRSLREGHRAKGAVPVEGVALGAWTHHPALCLCYSSLP